MSRKLNSSLLGAWTFFASPHAIDMCGINGLPLTPNSIRILGQFQKLKCLSHGRICLYLDVKRGKHERIMIVSEFYRDGLHRPSCRDSFSDSKSLVTLAFEVLDGLSYLHSQDIIHRCLSPSCILLDSEGHVKLSNYGLYFMTEGGTSVSFPIGSPKYVAPEVLLNILCVSSDRSSSSVLSGPKCDVWSFGMILLELALGIELWDGYSLEDIFQEILLLLKLDTGQSVLSSLIRDHDAIQKLQVLPSNLKLLIEACLTVIPNDRPGASDLLSHSVFKEHNLDESSRALLMPDVFLTTELRCKHLEIKKNPKTITDHLAELPLREVYYLWQLAGGDVETELKRQELIKAKPSIVTISNVVVEEGEEFGHKKDRAFLLDDTVITLPLEPLRHRLRDVDEGIYYPLIQYIQNGLTATTSLSDLQETATLPLVIKEKDIEYQLHRIILYRRLLEAYPYKRPQIIREAKVDIPPLYRANVWASLLEVEGDIQGHYDRIDKETPTPTDRQIEVDIPRCHQYDELLSSPTGHQKFKRILKAWVVSHLQYVYWQGLDSLCAPFLYLNFNDEALAYACFSSFIPKYLHNFFLKDNSSVIQEYLAKFSHLIAFHDPELTNHLDNIGFIPELYAIPWFLTMYTHVFPLHKIFHLWDTLLLGNASFPLCVGVAILKQLKSSLLSYGFNECILMFSDMPDIDIQRCVQESIKIFCSSPKSITYREHENFNIKSPKQFDRLGQQTEDSPQNSELAMTAVPLHVLKSEVSPRISAEDLLELMNFCPSSDSRSKVKHEQIKVFVVDVRSHEEFSCGSIPDSVNIPFQTAFSPEGTLGTSERQSLSNCKGKILIIVGSNKNNYSAEFANRLVRLGYSRVCTLHGGVWVI